MTTQKRSHGWMWWDNRSTLKQKIERAIVRYQEKFGCRPSACHINIVTYLKEANRELRLCGLPVVGDRGIPLHHFWLEHRGKPPVTPEEKEQE